MALIKTVPTGTGVDATYWRITSADAQHDAGAVQACIGGYVSEATRRAGHDPLLCRLFTVPAAALPGGTHNAPTADLYAAVKAMMAAAPRPQSVGAGGAGSAPDPLAGAADA